MSLSLFFSAEENANLDQNLKKMRRAKNNKNRMVSLFQRVG